MISQVIFKIDRKLKDKAMKKAQSQGIAFSTILQQATKAFVEGDLEVGIITPSMFNARTEKELLEALEDITHKRNLSPAFDSAEDAIDYLKNLK